MDITLKDAAEVEALAQAVMAGGGPTHEMSARPVEGGGFTVRVDGKLAAAYSKLPIDWKEKAEKEQERGKSNEAKLTAAKRKLEKAGYNSVEEALVAALNL